MTLRESAFLFGCEGEELVGLIAVPADDVEMSAVGVLVVVGGPQYRVGSHRQFVLLSRFLAEKGIPCMRFDYRGMGDASGTPRVFEEVDDDLKAAMDEFFRQVPSLKKVVIWGLCDGASAACLYARHESRVAGLVLLNPWVKTDAGVARTFLKHYYLRRLFDPSFWKKLFSGRVSIGKSAGELVGAAKLARGTAPVEPENVSLPERMGAALSSGAVPFVFFLSRRDFVAREFEDVAGRVPTWQQLLKRDSCFGIQHFEADHTFSTTKAKADVACATLEQVQLFARWQGDLL
ncbi:hydrolase 1, exosortase A system-associated [Thauera sp.]|jgi:exosortase A-associated hydrolase 1|uniref:hydrolase 1, exosortase A system-associated n=1 Tax=Thauera sp. TaxID=1905334 RepID=UPI002A37191D|nr:hydrolase 1, exosortase A system-associated [Thauera sp.]MDX9885109.1 hydrolase 1, exosortase A system-associated [Thauera sp.]